MTSIDSIVLEVADPAAAERFYATAFGLGTQLRFRASQAPTDGFRGFTLSLVVSQPGNVDALVDAALAGGAKTIKPAAKSLWGYGATVEAPDGTVWTIATSKKKDSGPASKEFDSLVLLLGVEHVSASRKFYVERGLKTGKSFGSYVEFETGEIKLALNKRRALAKNAGVSPDGSGSHRIAVRGAVEPFTDPDGFAWETTSAAAVR
ncbi:glyoxalase [Amycolatopsis endophytica]|uniref:Catechol 2,3-dioxygenase-like lactoylglutathione lyase family enzyme n=1 Tax=Amycolatopsis endophytica TaxID=860233 RepID=A0A853BCN3_9PSEU|nr:glyoxalase [Amycolatopsis endophytica]NYI93133.1 catechol 2,3-dioxygenase-like lactoylglutathione lyase family enzyme [Amycolatopsis endophytica]